MTTSDSAAIEEPAFEVMAITGTPIFRITRRSTLRSVLSPLFPMARRTSSSRTVPTSPCKASPECKNVAGVPVLRRVAAILEPMIPDFPIPETSTCPWHAAMISTARTNAGEMFCRTDCRASISISRTLAISSRIFTRIVVCSREIKPPRSSHCHSTGLMPPPLQVLRRESFAEKKKNVSHTIPPGLQLFLADAIGIVNDDFPEPYHSIPYGLDLYLFAKGHAIAA